MRVKTLSFSTTDLNVAYSAAVKKDAFLIITEDDKTYYRYPKAIKITNTTGGPIEIALIESGSGTEDQTEEQLFDLDKQAFGWIFIGSNEIFIKENMPAIKKISAKDVDGSGAASALRIDLFSFSNKVLQP